LAKAIFEYEFEFDNPPAEAGGNSAGGNLEFTVENHLLK
jgi:hypothetical protein